MISKYTASCEPHHPLPVCCLKGPCSAAEESVEAFSSGPGVYNYDVRAGEDG